MPRKKEIPQNGQSDFIITLTPEERLVLENFQLKISLLNREFQAYIAKLQEKYNCTFTEIISLEEGKLRAVKNVDENKTRAN